MVGTINLNKLRWQQGWLAGRCKSSLLQPLGLVVVVVVGPT